MDDDALIKLMFASVDDADWTTLSRCFHPEVTYERPGYEPLIGRDRVMRFYQRERAVAGSRHVVEGALVSAASGAAWGTMTGTLKSGATVGLRFAEVYEFRDGAIRRRRSYFFVPAV